MDHDVQPAGSFQWNRAGWFGGQVGATLWLLVLAALLTPRDPLLGALMLAVWAAPNALGLVLWRRRRSLAPYPAVQLLIAASGGAALGAVLLLRLFDISDPELGLPTPWFLLVYPGLMAVFHFRESTARD